MHWSSDEESLQSAPLEVSANSSSAPASRSNVTSFGSDDDEDYFEELKVTGQTNIRTKRSTTRNASRRASYLSKRNQRTLNGVDKDDDPAELAKKDSSEDSDDHSKESFYGSEEDDFVQPLEFDRPGDRKVNDFQSAARRQPKRSTWCPAKSRIAPSLLARPKKNNPLPPSLQPKRDSLFGGRSFLGDISQDILAVQKLNLDLSEEDEEEEVANAQPFRCTGNGTRAARRHSNGTRSPHRASSLGRRPGRRSSLPVHTQRDIILDCQEDFSNKLHSCLEKACDSSESSLELDINDLLVDSDDDDSDSDNH